MDDMVTELKAAMIRLLSDADSREELADWAMARIKDETQDYSSNLVVWNGLGNLAGVDLQQAPGVYLHGEEDFRAWLAELG